MSGYIGTQPVPQATQTRDSFTATSGQTSFATGGYTPNFLDVYLNGVKLAAADYTATNGSDVVLASGASTGDILEVVAFTTFNSASSSIDDNGNAVALTIDSSENVLIGNTDATPYTRTSGNAIAMGDGLISSAQSGGNAAIFNRMTNDGSIIGFRKDGTAVGNIGTASSTTYIAGDASGIRLGSTAFMPSTTVGANKDASVDLGHSAVRFKDLYLSGGVYLGGTGSANKLEDYEEGTWTPTAVSNCTIPTIENAHYTKVGNKVHLSFWVKTSNTASNIVMSGLPFEVTPNQRFTGAASDVINLNNISNQLLYLNIYFYNVPTGTNRDLMFGVSYKTNS